MGEQQPPNGALASGAWIENPGRPEHAGLGPESRQNLEKNGYVVIRDILDQSELERLERALRKHFEHSWCDEGLGKHQPNAAICIPEIGWIFAHPKLVAALRGILDVQQLVFTGNCDAHMNMLSWWHKDTSESLGGCFLGDYFQRADCRVYRVGLYLQNHEHGGGLTVRKGSHRMAKPDTGEIERLETRAGDVILFDIRLTHAGQFADPIEYLILRGSRTIKRLREGRRIKDAYQRLLQKPDKLSLFFTYGALGAATEEYCQFELRAKQQGSARPNDRLPGNLVSALKTQNVICHPGMTIPGSCASSA